MIQISYGWLCVGVIVLFFFTIGVWHVAMGLVAPRYAHRDLDRVLERLERIAEYNAAIAELTQAQPIVEPQVHVGTVVIPAQRKEEDLLPPPSAVSHGEAPLFDTLPMPLPPFDIDYGFVFGAPSWSAQTGVFPVIEEPEPKARERFATPPPKTRKRKPSVKVTVGDEVRQAELAEAATA
jgi:hypothetical protein